jgi:hypothetical protein
MTKGFTDKMWGSGTGDPLPPWEIQQGWPSSS